MNRFIRVIRVNRVIRVIRMTCDEEPIDLGGVAYVWPSALVIVKHTSKSLLSIGGIIVCGVVSVPQREPRDKRLSEERASVK